jgi:hypothetical protein
MDGTLVFMGEGKLVQFLVGKREGNWSLERRRRKCEDMGLIYGHYCK